MFAYNESQAMFMAHMHHQQLMREARQLRLEKEQLRSLESERTAQRQFRLLYHVRRLMHRLLPGMARAMFF
jgi:hypothetical protein